MKHSIEIPFKEHTLRGYHHQVGSDSCLVMLHGYTGNCNENDRFRGISEALEEIKIDSLRVNFLCHGESDLTFKDMRFHLLVEQGREILSYTRKLGYKDVYLLGYSMGGLTALHLLDEDIKSLILMSPAYGFRRHVETFYSNAMKDETGIALQGHREISKEFVASLNEIDANKFQDTFEKEILVVMGVDDEVISFDEVVTGISKFKNVTVKDLTNCGHGFTTLQSRIQLQEAVKQFLK